MCGIVGTYNMPGAASDFPGMLDSIAHRGPDAASVKTVTGANFTCTLGHRRLSIIDLTEAANQPLSKAGLSIIFNGEIYNYAELRRELSAGGVSFDTHSDTEVLLEAWRNWGVAGLGKLRGMFAFAILDDSSGELVLARDPFGIKPLHYVQDGPGLAFASELKALAPVVDKQLDPQGLVASLIYGWVPDSYSLWQGVKKLPAGYIAVQTPGRQLKLERYYDLLGTAEEAMRGSIGPVELRSIIEDSVRAHMVADVPVATFLSGGLDSSLTTVLAKRQTDSLDSFTITFRPEDEKLEAMPDDLRFARQIARLHDIRLHEIQIAPDLVQTLPRMVGILDEPVSDAGAINTVLVCTAARELGVKVLLSGIGADEIFAGYRKHQGALLAAQYRRIPGFLRHGLIEPAVSMLPVSAFGRGLRSIRFMKQFLSFSNLPEDEGFMRSYAYLDRDSAKKILRPDLEPFAERVFRDHAAIYAEASRLDTVNRMCITDIRLFLQSLNLMYTDRASMAASTEVRVPFVDTSVVRAAFSITGDQKVRGNSRKDVLKQAARGILPDEVIFRPKAAFSAPLRAWTQRDLKDMIRDHVAGGELARSGWVSKTWINSMISENQSGASDYSHELWQLLTTELWLDKNGVRL